MTVTSTPLQCLQPRLDTYSATTLSITAKKRNTQYMTNNVMLSVIYAVFLHCNGECHYAACRCTECCGAIPTLRVESSNRPFTGKLQPSLQILDKGGSA